MGMNNDGRPDPEALLEKVQRDEAQAARGKLKIFFGAAPGVGKTYAMLEAARKRQPETDLVVGVVETHGRQETEAAVCILHPLPMRAPSWITAPGPIQQPSPITTSPAI